MAKLVTAAAEYAKDIKLRPTDIAQLREWLKKQPHLPQCITEEFLIAVLHSSEYSIEQAKQLLEINITCRTDYEFFANRNPLTKEKRAVWDGLDYWIDPNKTTKENYRILFSGLNNYDPEYFNFPVLLNVFVSVIDTVVATDGVCPGYILILDCRGVSLSHLAKASLSLIRDILNYIQDAILIKIKAIHLIYVSPVIDKIMFVIKPFLRKALLDMLNFHTGEMEAFYKAVPKNLLPTNIGGINGSHKDLVAATRNKVETMSDWLIEQEKLVIDDSKRISNKKDTFKTMAGSFKKLDID